jgi:hypothetical protein
MARAHPCEDGRDQQPEEFEHALSIADLRPARGSQLEIHLWVNITMKSGSLSRR